MDPLTATTRKRIDSIDILRGIIMIIMALDHVRDFFHLPSAGDPTNMATTTPIFFFTRWITHFCAPLFVFLSGAAVYLNGLKRSRKELSIFLLKRGVSLVLIELFIFNLLFSFNPFYQFIGLQVIWVTGWSMILLAGLIYLPLRALVIIGIVLVAGHNLLDRFNAPSPTEGSVWWALLHQSHFQQFANGRTLFILYPLIPWPGIMLLGYGIGSLFAKDVSAGKRQACLLRIGAGVTVAFFIIRGINVYGDNLPWAYQRSPVITLLSFFNVTKYPPSLLYCCMTIGPGMIALALLEKTKGAWTTFVVIYGRVPMFYYLLHFFFIHLACMIIFFINGHTWADGPKSGFMWFRPDDFGYSLGIVYLIWIALVMGLYPLCKWYSKYKATHSQWWLSYL